ncbi:hypothetical protein EWM64_g9059 [Hericium alpestre]|uniref:Uncharacterized protein n=1 Tax=Hericium alpestre TaxID=135208 RepID=A0A4Y9ZFK2_9AGAM|nr:hypothetical protein EWM64_g10476 [Hericium alpestre]TFY74950.1 hypothetical protein EWM64_g9059 [Hericium alpestre]
MSRQPPQGNFYPSQQRPPGLDMDPVDNYKPSGSSYDDLIDQYATPYGVDAKHKPYALDPSSNVSFATEEDNRKTFYDAEDPRRSMAYPPSQDVRGTKDTRKLYQRILPDSIACRFYVFTVLIETAIDLGIEGDLLLRFHRSDNNQQDDVLSRKMPVYLSVFAFAHVFQFAMALDAVYARNTLQFISLSIFNALLLVYAVIQTSEIRHSLGSMSDPKGISHLPVDVLTTILPIVISVAEIAYIALGWRIYTEFGWKVYKFLGADRTIRKMFTHYQIYQCLIKFDVFFFVGFCIQFIWLVLESHNWEFYITCAALPFSIVLLIEGHLAARYESRMMMFTFMAGCAGALVYFAYKLIKVLIHKTEPDFAPVWQSLTTFSIIAIILLMATFVYACIVMKNFGRGLKEQITKKQMTSGGSKHNKAYPSLSVRPNRMSIE